VFFGVRAVHMESRFAQTAREERLMQAADLFNRQLERELEALKRRADTALWPLRESRMDLEAMERATENIAAEEPLLGCGVLFDGEGEILGPDLPLPFAIEKQTAEGAGEGIDPLDGRPVEVAEVAYRHGLAMKTRLKEARFAEDVKQEPLKALEMLDQIVREAEEADILAQALYHSARIRLALGDTRAAARLAESFVTRGLEGPGEAGEMPLRGKMFLLWAEAWNREGLPERALEYLFWLWDELLDGSFQLDLEGFTRAEEEVERAVRLLIDREAFAAGLWRERLGEKKKKGAQLRAKALERRLLSRQVVPRAVEEPQDVPGPWYRTFLLEDRLEVFLFFPPREFDWGSSAGRKIGAGFRVDVKAVEESLFLPFLNVVSSEEAEMSLVDHGGRRIRGNSPGDHALTWPLSDPFNAWQVVVWPGPADPGRQRARSRKLFHVTLVACAVLAVTGSALLLLWSYRRAAQLAALRSEFVSAVTHDLKTPLTSIRMFVETLGMGRLKDPSRATRYYELIGSEVERLERLIDNILEFARIEAGRRAYEFLPVDLESLAADLVQAFRPTAEVRGFAIETELEPVPEIRGDADALRRALWNLLSNAVKFSTDRKWIGVRVTPSGGGASVEVADGGMGIPAPEKEKIFEKFYRGREVEEGGRSGTGLGLALVRHVVRGHNGRIEVESAPGEGSRFRLLFPPAAEGAEGAGKDANAGGD